MSGAYGAISPDDFKESLPVIGFHGGFGDEWLKIHARTNVGTVGGGRIVYDGGSRR